ncbi:MULTISPECIES: 3'-5' exonuclease [unclassified Clostridioides]|uniref:exonuclease domain-containing protein n=1 Tax=unclassified Clostridioides TaxID=2635829 RepID=UPI001FAD0FD5|nr:exonuclease domain-containing protein [Clostridioides difficile]
MKYKLFIDFEFNMLDDNKNKLEYNGAELISIGGVLVDNEFNIMDDYYSLVKPKYNEILSNKCKKLTKLNQLDIDNAPNLLYVMDDFYRWFCKFNDITIYNWGDFDIAGLLNSFRVCKYTGKCLELFNMMIDIQPFISQHITYNNRILSRQLSLLNMKKIFSVEGEIKHNSLSDAMDLMKVCKSFYLNYPKDINTLEELYNKLPPIKTPLYYIPYFEDENFELKFEKTPEDIIIYLKQILNILNISKKEIYFKKRSVLVNNSKIINFKNLSSSFKLIKLNEFEEYPDFILKLGDKNNFAESVIKINKSNRKSIKNLILKLSRTP